MELAQVLTRSAANFIGHLLWIQLMRKLLPSINGSMLSVIGMTQPLTPQSISTAPEKLAIPILTVLTQLLITYLLVKQLTTEFRETRPFQERLMKLSFSIER